VPGKVHAVLNIHWQDALTIANIGTKILVVVDFTVEHAHYIAVLYRLWSYVASDVQEVMQESDAVPGLYSGHVWTTTLARFIDIGQTRQVGHSKSTHVIFG